MSIVTFTKHQVEYEDITEEQARKICNYIAFLNLSLTVKDAFSIISQGKGAWGFPDNIKVWNEIKDILPEFGIIVMDLR
jgi:uncharacterized membrane protein YoaT (DUF817 family)